MYSENVGGVSCSFSRRIQTLSEYYKRIFSKIETGKTRFSCQRIVSGNIKANVAFILFHTELVTLVSNRGRSLTFQYSFRNFVFMRYA